MPRPLSIVLLLELGLAVFLATSTCTLRGGFLAAARTLREHPASAEALAEFRRQQLLAEWQPVWLTAMVFAVFALPTWWLAARHRPRPPAPERPALPTR